MRRVHIDKRGSVTAALSVASEALLSDVIDPRQGALIAARVKTRNTRYGKLEDVHGRPVELFVGDVVVGALGERQALHGHGGTIPQALEVGDTIQMLNLGGVMGLCHTSNPDVGAPIDLEVLGAVMAFPTIGSRVGVLANLDMAPQAKTLPLTALDVAKVPPIVVVSGTCMNSGKTLAACAIVRTLKGAGMTVRVAKLTGVAAKKDVMSMVDCGAIDALTFVDVGLPSTTRANASLAAKQVLRAATLDANLEADVIVIELGDGLLGAYGVMEILTDPVVKALPTVHVCCASDPVGAYGAAVVFDKELGVAPDLFTGPVTDNAVGCDTIEATLKVPAINAIQAPAAFGAAVLKALDALAPSPQTVIPFGTNVGNSNDKTLWSQP